ncbi:hypothetical protein BUALT_Bualt03G0052000 [Buddleja alternifolia]|uniref:Glutaredoxin domain-containing protein n=1 Tax=Buddleja alternifolia TaxID=168488 RepID=A0AAV6XZK0_9LAMI|nr:hypothetical protein BUALT_Bualt03G0052000 [Buddleja alternifolia]
MQQALPYRDWLSATVSAAPPSENINSGGEVVSDNKSVRKLVAENAVAVLARKGCCMCHVVKLLLHGHGVNPTIIVVDDQNEDEVTNELAELVTGAEASGNAAAASPKFPAVFVGGELFGGLEEVMGAHISGELVPRLREARALWL